MSVLGRLRIAFDRFPTFFEEPEVVRYVTLAESAGGFTVPDPAAELPLSDRHFLDIDAPGLIKGSLPVIFFRTAHTGSPRFGVRLNATPLTQQTLSEAGPHTWHEIVPTGALKPEDNLFLRMRAMMPGVRHTYAIDRTERHRTAQERGLDRSQR